MTDFIVALGLLLALEGIVFVALPGLARRAALEIAQMPPERLRLAGFVSALAGLAIIWLFRS